MFIREHSTKYIFVDERKRWYRKPVCFIGLTLFIAMFLPISQCGVDLKPKVVATSGTAAPTAPAAAPSVGSSTPSVISRDKIATAFEGPLHRNEFPASIDLPGAPHAVVKYTIDAPLQNEMQKLFEAYKPDYGAFVAMDAATGRILSLVSYTHKSKDLGNLALKTMFPSASVFKIVTATAAIDRERATKDTVIAFTGANHTLYRKNVTDQAPRRWARRMTIKEAFARSVNTVFAKLGVFFLKPFELEEYARRFQFNQAIAADLPVQPGKFTIPDSDPFVLAELASGYNRLSLMSPVQGAMIAAAVANDGVMMEPHIVDGLSSEDGRALYGAEARQASVVMSPETAAEVRALMHETVVRGTGRKSFFTFVRKRSGQDLELGGKTGSLMSLTPRGKCDWFVGYGRKNGKKIAVAALTVNESNWKVKSSYLSRAFLERYFQDPNEVQVASHHHRRRRH